MVCLLREKICSPASFPSNPLLQASNKSWVKKSLCSSAVTTKILFFFVFFFNCSSLKADLLLRPPHSDNRCWKQKSLLHTWKYFICCTHEKTKFSSARKGVGRKEGESFRWILEPSSRLKEEHYIYTFTGNTETNSAFRQVDKVLEELWVHYPIQPQIINFEILASKQQCSPTVSVQCFQNNRWK